VPVGDQLLWCDSLLDVPRRACGDKPNEKGKGDWTATHEWLQ